MLTIMFYLSKEDWSPRFDTRFFTIDFQQYTELDAQPSEPSETANDDDDGDGTISQSSIKDTIVSNSTNNPNPNLKDTTSSLGGKCDHPAMYYPIHVYSSHQKHIVYRRYSQFHHLHQTLLSIATATDSNTTRTTTTATATPTTPRTKNNSKRSNNNNRSSSTTTTTQKQNEVKVPSMPPKTLPCWPLMMMDEEQVQEFWEERQDGLERVLMALLCRSEFVEHHLMRQFLRLDLFRK